MPPDEYDDIVNAAIPAPSLRRTVRGAEKLKGVQPELVDHWNNLQDEFSKAGLSPAIKSGFRTAEQQHSLHVRGYPTKGNDGYIKISPHQEGRALDISFSAAQKPRGRQIIADYARRKGLSVPSDEPWHLALPKAQQDDYADVVNAAAPKKSATPTDDSYDDIIQAASPSVTKQVTKQPSVEDALKGLMADATRRTSQIKPVAPKPVGMGDVQQASRERPMSLGELRQSEDQPIGFSKQGQPSRVPQTADELRVMKGEQPVNRQAYARQQEAQTRLSKMRELGNDFDPEKERQWQAVNAGAIQLEKERYKRDIASSAGGDAGRWLSEFGSKAGAGLAELGGGLGSDTLRIKAEAAKQAAEESGADRNVVSKFVQNVGAGLVSSIPELAAMKLGAPPAAAFATGSALRAGGSGQDPNKAAISGLGQALAFETPIPQALGGGLKEAAAKGLGTAGASTLSEVAMGQPLKEAAITGATTGLMRGIPEAMRHGIPEKPETIQAQLEERGYSLIPPDTPRPPIPRGFRAEKTADGVVYYDPKRIDAATIKNTPTQELLGHVEPKSEATTETVVVRKPDGTEIQASAVSPENVPAQAEVMKGQYPEAKIETGGPEVAEKVLADRVEPREAEVVKPWEMTRDQVEEEFQRKKSEDANLEKTILGEELAKKYERLQRTANSSTATKERADAAYAEIEKIEASLSETDRNRLYGIGEEGVTQLDEWRDYRQSLNNLDPSDPQSLAESMRWAVSRVGRETDPAKMNHEQRVAYGTLREAARIAHENGWDTQAISREAVRAAAGRYSDPEDAAFMLDRFLKKEPAPQRNLLGETPAPQPETRFNQPETQAMSEMRAAELKRLSERPPPEPPAGSGIQSVAEARETITPAQDTKVGQNAAGEQLYERADGSRYRMRTDRSDKPHGYPDFGGDLVPKGETLETPVAPNKPVETADTSERSVGDSVPPINEPKGVPVKTAAIEAERAEAGLNPIEKQQYRNVGESFLKGKQAVENKKIDPRALAAEVAKTERPLTDEETGALGYDRARLRNEYDEKITELNKAIDAKSDEGIAANRAQLEEIERLADANDAALEKGGREQSIAFNARKMLVGRDYSLLGTLQRAKAAKGESLSPQERGRIETLTKQLAEAEKTISQYESARESGKSNRAIKKLIDETQREARGARRAITKETLDTEFAQLSQQFKAKMTGVQPAGIDPTLVPIIAKMARNRVQAGFNTVEGLVDELHSHLKDVIEDKRAIRDAFSGYGQESKARTKNEITEELGRLKREARKLSKEEDRNPVTEAAKKEASRQKAVKTRLAKQITDLEEQLRTKDYSKPERSKLEYDKDAERLLAHRDLLKDRIEREIAKQKKPLWEDYLSWWQQGTILSGTRTLAKLGSYALGKNVIIPIEDVIGGAMSHVPGLRGLSKASPRYGGGVRENVAAQGAAFKEFVNKAIYQDAWTSLKEGTNALKLKHGDGKYQYSPRLLTFIRGLHMAEKVFASRPEYYRAIEKETQWAVRNGLNPQDPKVQSQILARSYMNGLRAQLMQPNIPSKLLSTANAWLESVGRTQKIGQLKEPGIGHAARLTRTGIRTLFPITRVPFNYVNEALSYNPVGGLAKGGVRMGAEAIKTLRSKGIGKGVVELAQQGMRNMPPEAADATKRALIKGSLGVPFFLIGWYNYQNIGGYYQPGQRKEGDVPFGGLRIGGYDIPRTLVHNPLFETMHFAATMRRVYEGKKEGGSYPHAAEEAGKGLIEETPFIDVPRRIAQAIEGKAGMRKMAGDVVRSATIPPDVQRVASMKDSIEPTTTGQKVAQIAGLKEIKAVKRRPEGFVDTFKMGVPGLRETVPISKIFGSQSSKASNEVQRLGVGLSGAVKQPDESDEIFKMREAFENGNIRTQIENVVALPDYNKSSDERKKEYLQKASAYAADVTKKAIPEQPEQEKKDEADFAMPELAVKLPSGFERAFANQALDRFEKMNPNQRAKVYNSMAEKAWLLTHSAALTDAEKEAFRQRLEKLGVTPQPPNQPKTRARKTLRQHLSAQ